MGFTDYLKSREKAFEEEFFTRENRRLTAALHAEQADEQARAGLEAVSGIHDGTVLSHLLDAGMSAKTVSALALYPLVAVAWADGRLEPAEREAVLTAAHESGGIEPGSAARAVLEHWLEADPGEGLHDLWRDYALALAGELDPFARRMLREALVARSRKVAEAAGGLLGLTNPVSSSEQQMLAEIAAVFGDEERSD